MAKYNWQGWLGQQSKTVSTRITLSGRRQRKTASFWKEVRRAFQGSGRGTPWASLLSKMAWKAPAWSANPAAKPYTNTG